ncbi:MAG TPA: type II toxin-antitoxin system VapC family toxin [Saprospiraceae bacterium]|nr:type II toxin-antitoxin system VapC family toxin [Saprospiraceae bacterium]
MKILDSNILIYAAQPSFAFLVPLVTDAENAVSIVTKIETLGFPRLLPGDKLYLESTFTVLQVLDLLPEIAEKAIEIRQAKKISLGDAIVAATALVHDCPLVTRNIVDFRHIPDLKLENPIP